ncbi:hypothetical protein RFI_33322, partial [Reticulomyxa filosa]
IYIFIYLFIYFIHSFIHSLNPIVSQKDQNISWMRSYQIGEKLIEHIDNINTHSCTSGNYVLIIATTNDPSSIDRTFLTQEIFQFYYCLSDVGSNEAQQNDSKKKEDSKKTAPSMSQQLQSNLQYLYHLMVINGIASPLDDSSSYVQSSFAKGKKHRLKKKHSSKKSKLTKHNLKKLTKKAKSDRISNVSDVIHEREEKEQEEELEGRITIPYPEFKKAFLSHCQWLKYTHFQDLQTFSQQCMLRLLSSSHVIDTYKDVLSIVLDIGKQFIPPSMRSASTKT